MSVDERIETMINNSLGIIEKEIDSIQTKQTESSLDNRESAKLVEFLKTLILVQKDKRLNDDKSPNNLSQKELDELIEQEIKKLSQ